MGNGNKGKEYKPFATNLPSCPPAVDNFDLEKSSMLEFEEITKILSAKKKHLKKSQKIQQQNMEDGRWRKR